MQMVEKFGFSFALTAVFASHCMKTHMYSKVNMLFIERHLGFIFLYT